MYVWKKDERQNAVSLGVVEYDMSAHVLMQKTAGDLFTQSECPSLLTDTGESFITPINWNKITFHKVKKFGDVSVEFNLRVEEANENAKKFNRRNTLHPMIDRKLSIK